MPGRHGTECTTSLRTAYEHDRALYGVDNSRLSAGSVVSQSTSVIIGFFSFVLFEKVGNVAPEDHEWQTTLVFLAVAIVLMRVQKFYFRTLGFWTWRTNKHWSSLMMRFLSFVSLTILFIATHFLLTAVTHSWSSWHLSWLEGIASITATMLLAFFWVNVYSQAQLD